VSEPDPAQRRGGPLAAAGQACAGVQERVSDVVQGGGVLGQEELLEHEPDRGGPQRGDLPVGKAGHVKAGDAHGAGSGPVQGAHQVRQRRLPRP
jgi:hypothetical protein